LGYHPEPYWSRVATEIRKRGPYNCLAGNDNPFFRYKRQKFLARFLSTMDFDAKVVLEVGSGPGGNLLQIVQTRARRVIGIDISREMLDLAAETLKGYETIVELHKTDGEHLPLADGAVDLAFTVTVLQHNTDSYMFQSLVGEICRVTKHTVVLMEDTGRGFVGPSFMVRSVEAYAAECRKHEFQLTDCRYLGLRVSRMAYALVRRLLVSPSHPEGKPFGFLPVAALRVLLSLTRPFDEVIPDKGDLTRMVFVRDSAT
jgi:SAM-dependent methyltransferase